MRRTNIFYNSNSNTDKFFTFSNYTEALTGNFLSTDTKLFPSRFFCAKLEGLTSDNKQSLINLLIRYYENKLAVLRDKNSKNYTILSLNYLLEFFYKLQLEKSEEDDTTKWVLAEELKFNTSSFKDTEIDNYTKEISSYYNDDNKPYFTINYIGDITEQDYDGTYTDTICVVNIDNIISGSLLYKDNPDETLLVSGINYNYLWGWSSKDIDNIVKSILHTDEDDLCPIDDIGELNDDNRQLKNIYYRYSSDLCGIKFNYNNETEDDLSFNIIIPLFDMVDINYKNNFTTIDYEYLDLGKNYPGINITDTTENNLRIKNIPLGIWISDSGVELKRDGEYAPTWSLTISSQFKPFPYSNNIARSSSSDSKSNAYSTFAEVLIKLNKAIDKFDDMHITIQNLENRIQTIEGNLKQIGTIHNIDGIQQEIELFKAESNNSFTTFKNEVNEVIESLKWKVSI